MALSLPAGAVVWHMASLIANCPGTRAIDLRASCLRQRQVTAGDATRPRQLRLPRGCLQPRGAPGEATPQLALQTCWLSLLLLPQKNKQMRKMQLQKMWARRRSRAQAGHVRPSSRATTAGQRDTRGTHESTGPACHHHSFLTPPSPLKRTPLPPATCTEVGTSLYDTAADDICRLLLEISDPSGLPALRANDEAHRQARENAGRQARSGSCCEMGECGRDKRIFRQNLPRAESGAPCISPDLRRSHFHLDNKGRQRVLAASTKAKY